MSDFHSKEEGHVPLDNQLLALQGTGEVTDVTPFEEPRYSLDLGGPDMFPDDPLFWSDLYLWPWWRDEAPALPAHRHKRIARREGFYPRVNVFESTDAFLVQVRLPGVLPEEVEAHLENGVLTVRGVKHRDEHKGEYHHWERATGRFVRRVRLPAAVDPESVEASCGGGILTLKVVKAREAKGRRVPVTTG